LTSLINLDLQNTYLSLPGISLGQSRAGYPWRTAVPQNDGRL